MRDVWVQENAFGGQWWYVVYVDGKPYDSMRLLTGPPLSFKDQNDMADLYREALDPDPDM